jgi:hypothetical protein
MGMRIMRERYTTATGGSKRFAFSPRAAATKVGAPSGEAH